ncbi:2-oxoglutarate and iron-dependent oxygenase domain-containing protein [Pseudomonas aeruginosa]|nr:2-oxoglutarate and iron-dependent oxygenase domain-containing protein [Pseudomonas aeruginosa]
MADTFSNNAEAKRAVAWEIHKACRDIGFFYIKNHGIPEGMLQAQIECARRFFQPSPEREG